MTLSLRRELTKIAKNYKVKIRFQKQKTTSGLTFFETETIYINPELERRDESLSVLFHEICHIICYRTHKFHNYHNPEVDRKIKAKIALRAERFVDKMAKKELYNYDSEVMFWESYQDPESAKWLKEYYLK